MKFTLARDEGGLTVLPDHPEVRDFLTLTYRQMTKLGGRTKFETLKEPMYSLTSVRGVAALLTHQGFWQDLTEHLRKLSYEVNVQDVRRQVLDEPKYGAAMIGLKSYQKDWITDALKTGNSGLLGAPTRFGKSYGMTAIARAFPNATIVVTAPGVDLCKQLFAHFKEVLPHREVKGVFTGSRNSKQSADITVCSIDSLHKMDHDTTDILIIDEPHAAVSDERMPKIAAFNRARKYGFGATLNGRFDQKDRLIVGLIGPILSNVTYRQGVEWGAIAPLKVIMLTIPFSKDTLPGRWMDRDDVYKRLLTQSSRTAALVRKILEDVVPCDWQTMAFIKDEKQALFYMEHSILPLGTAIPDKGCARLTPEGKVTTEILSREEYLMEKAREYGTIAMAKRLKAKERDAVTLGIAQNEIIRVLASNIYVQGVTFPDLKVVLNLAGGGANTTAIQKPGRLLQTRPNKNYGVMVDFVFKCRDSEMETRQNPPYRGIVGECWARHAAYKEIGYDIEFVEDSDRAREIVLGAYSSDGDKPTNASVADSAKS